MASKKIDDLPTELGAKGPQAPAVATSYRLVVVQGSQANQGVTIEPSSPRVLVGTGSACQLVLSDRQVSRRHVAFDAGPAGLRITDLGSTNGTRVNDLAVVDAFLTGGETVRIGATVLRVEAIAELAP